MIDDQEALLNTLKAALAAWNSKDAKQFSEYFAEDAEFTDVVGQVMLNRTEIERLHIQPFSTILKNANLQTQEIRVKEIRTDVASVDIRWTTTGHRKPDGTPLPQRHGLLHLIAVRRNGYTASSPENDWQIMVAHNVDYTSTYGFQDAKEMAK